VQRINYDHDFYGFDANCTNSHGTDFISHEKWKLKRATNGDTYLVTDSDSYKSQSAIWKLSKESR
jgi:hypothetical protein